VGALAHDRVRQKAVGMKKRKYKINGPFAPRTIEMLKSPAWRVLSLSARRVLDRIEIELARHGGRDNGRLPVTYDDFENYGVHRHAIGPAQREAEALGFIEIEIGVAGNADFRHPNLFRLTYSPTSRKRETNEWRKIKTDVEAERIAAKARSKTPKFPSGGKRQKPVAETATGFFGGFRH
jgi:hypothetical protein